MKKVKCSKCDYEAQEDELLYRMVDRTGNEYNLCGRCVNLLQANDHFKSPLD